MALLLHHHEEAVGDAAGVAVGGNRQSDVAVSSQVDTAIRTEHQRGGDVSAGGAGVGAEEYAGGAGRSGLDGGNEDINAAAPTWIGSVHGEEIGGKGVAGEVYISGGIGLDVVGDFALGAGEVGGVDQEVRRIVGIDHGDKHVGVAGGVALHGIGSDREIGGERVAGEDDVVIGVESDLTHLVGIGAAEIGGVDQRGFAR